MPELRVDVTPLLRIAGALERFETGDLPATRRAFRTVGVNVFNLWRTSAANTPGVYRKPDYLNGLQSDSSIRDTTRIHGVAGQNIGVDIIHANPKLARQVHQGVASYDMKPDLVGTLRGQPRPSDGRSGNARLIVRDGRVVGRFNVVPLRHKADELGAGGAATFRAISPTKGSEGKPTQWGGRLSAREADAIAARPEARRAYEALVKARAARKLSEPTFKDFMSRFVGMVRSTQRYGKTTQSSYKTFRAVSVRTDGKGSSASSWIFPGWRGVDFPRNAIRDLAQEIRGTILDGIAADLKS